MGESGAEVTVLLADDHAMVREGFRKILEELPELRIVAEAGDGREAVELATRLRPDVALIEVVLPRLSGVEAAAEIRRSSPATRVVLVSSSPREDLVEQAVRAGASGFVQKRAATRELIEAVAAAREGRTYLSPELAQRVVSRLVLGADEVREGMKSLTRREREILQRVAEGLTAKEIAASLSIAVRTVETHRASLMRKLGVHKTAGLVRLAIREGLVAP